MPPAANINKQTEIIATLLFAQKLLGHDESYFQNPSTAPAPNTVAGRFAFIMNWFAQCFAHGKLGDVVATAAYLKPKDKANKSKTDPQVIQILVSSNKGKQVSAQDKAFGQAFINIINQQKAATYTTANCATPVQNLLNLVVQYGWDRVKSKIENIGAVCFRQGVQNQNALTKETFNAIFDHWCGGPNGNGTKHYGANDTPAQAKARAAALKSALNIILQPVTANDQAAKLAHLKKVSDNCKIVLEAVDFMLARGAVVPLPQINVIGPQKIVPKMHRRLWRVLRYTAGAQKFLTEGLGLFKTQAQAATMNDIKFEVFWIANALTDDVFTPTAAQISVDSFRAWYTREFITPLGTHINAERKAEGDRVVTGLINQNRNGFSWRPTFHCELALIYYILKTNIRIIATVIGVSKLNCFACSQYTQHFLPTTGQSFAMTGTSGKAHYQWMIPKMTGLPPAQMQRSTEAVDGILTRLKEDIQDYLMKHANRNSQGSDSSTGSGGMRASDVLTFGQ